MPSHTVGAPPLPVRRRPTGTCVPRRRHTRERADYLPARILDGRVVLLRRVLVLLALVSCAPPRSVDRAVLAPDAAMPDRPVSPDQGGGADRADDTVEPDAPPGPDAALEAAADTADAADPSDAAVDQAPSRTAVLVVGNKAMPTPGDTRLQDILSARGLAVTLVSDEDVPSVNGVHLVVLAESSASSVLGDKYRDVPVPVVVLERLVFFSMGMVNSNSIDQGVVNGTQVSITMPGHTMAAGLSGTISVVGAAADMGWGRPETGAERVAIIPGMTDRVVVFGYPRGAMLVIGPAPARRVGSFVMDGAARLLNDNGVKLLGAAIDWALQ